MSDPTTDTNSATVTPKPVTPKSITHDPIYFVTVAFFALLTTALPALLGQPRFLPIIQTLSLTTFIAVSLHNRNIRGALRVMAIWLPIQFVTLTFLTRLFPTQVEHAIGGAFTYRAAMLAWFFGGASYPAGLTEMPSTYLFEIVGIVVGSLITAGLVGVWFLVRLINMAAYGMGAVMISLANPIHTLLVIPYWTLVRAAGNGGIIVLCAMPLLTNQWSPSYYWRTQRNVLLVSVGLIVTGIVLELLLPGIVALPPLP
jgi:hypothetical protein